MSQLSELITRWCLSTNWRTRLSMCLAGGIYPLAFAPFHCWPVAPLSLALLCFALLANQTISPFKLGYYWGIGCFLVGASWVYVSIHEFGFVPAWGAATLTLVFAAFLALFKGVFGWLSGKLLDYCDSNLFLFIAPLAWLVSEALQSTLLNGFPWLLAGYSQIDSPLAPLATWLGVYGISWWLVLISAWLAMLLRFQWRRTDLAIGVLILGTIGLTQLDYHQRAPEKVSHALDVALIQPNVPQLEKWDPRYFGKIVDVLYQLSSDAWGADLVIWPEGAIPAYAHQVRDILFDLQQRAAQSGSHLILGIPEYELESRKSFVALDAFGATEQHYYKQVLVPFGEYVPLENWLRGAIDFLNLPMSGFSEVDRAQQPMHFEGYYLIPAICYEIAYPEIIRALAAQAGDDPKVIVTVSNEAWFGDSFGPYQHMQMAQMRALELGIPLVRATNDGITAIVDARGQIAKQLPRYQRKQLRWTLPLTSYATPYRRYGLAGLGGILAFSLIFIGLSVWRRSHVVE